MLEIFKHAYYAQFVKSFEFRSAFGGVISFICSRLAETEKPCKPSHIKGLRDFVFL